MQQFKLFLNQQSDNILLYHLTNYHSPGELKAGLEITLTSATCSLVLRSQVSGCVTFSFELWMSEAVYSVPSVLAASQ